MLRYQGKTPPTLKTVTKYSLTQAAAIWGLSLNEQEIEPLASVQRLIPLRIARDSTYAKQPNKQNFPNQIQYSLPGRTYRIRISFKVHTQGISQTSIFLDSQASIKAIRKLSPTPTPNGTDLKNKKINLKLFQIPHKLRRK